MTSAVQVRYDNTYLYLILLFLLCSIYLTVKVYDRLQEIESRADKPLVICIEGNIGSGKSTLIKHLTNRLKDVVPLEEPTQEWQHFHGNNMLDIFYTSPIQHGFLVQVFLQISLFKAFWKVVQNIGSDKIVLMERSMVSSKEFFIPTMKTKGYVTDHEANVASYLCDTLAETTHVDILVYLKSDPQTCLERIKARGRKEEVDHIDIDYLEQLHCLHESWSDRCRPIIIDVDNCSPEEVAQSLCEKLRLKTMLYPKSEK